MYLAFVAFMPFPVALISEYPRNPVAFALFSVSMATVSLLELVMYVVAARRGHTQIAISRRTVRHALLASGVPVVVILLSIPLAMLGTGYALAVWLLLVPWRTIMQAYVPKS